MLNRVCHQWPAWHELSGAGARGSRGASACATGSTSGTDGPAIGKADGDDSADRACQIVLRDVGLSRRSVFEDFHCYDNGCNYVWRGSLDVAAEALADGSTPHVLYQVRGQVWYETDAEPVDDGTYEFAFSYGTISKDVSPEEFAQRTLDVIPFLRTEDGGRVFDHNRNPSDFDNYVLGPPNTRIERDTEVCAE